MKSPRTVLPLPSSEASTDWRVSHEAPSRDTVHPFAADPLSHLDYFTEWGGSAWERLVRIGIEEFLGTKLDGLHVLDFGTRYGRMGCLFALLGARVTGIDVHGEFVAHARLEAQRLGVSRQTEFIQYDGDLSSLPSCKYDIIFSKSVLVIVDDRPCIIRGLERLLKDDGRIVFVENGLGNVALRLARRLKHHGKWDYKEARFFTSEDDRLLRSMFRIERTSRSFVPPVYLFCGRKAQRSPRS